MAKRRSAKDLLTPEPTPDKQLTHPSGWCITNEHDGCKYQFSHGKCGCDCHLSPKLRAAKAEAVVDDSSVNTEHRTASPDDIQTPETQTAPTKRRGRPPKIITMPEKQAVSSTTIMDNDPRPWRK